MKLVGNLKIKLDQVVEEIELLMQELNHNINFYDDSVNMSFAKGNGTENFSLASKIEKFIAYIQKYESNLFREIRGIDGLCHYNPTNLSAVFNPYDFLYYRAFDPQSYLRNYEYFSPQAQQLVLLLDKHYRTIDSFTSPETLHSLPTITKNVAIPKMDYELTDSHKKRLNFFVSCLRDCLSNQKYESNFQALQRKTNSKFNDYAKYIDELFKQKGDLTFVCLELCVDNLIQNEIYDLNLEDAKVPNKLLLPSVHPKYNLVALKGKLLNNARNVDPLSRSVGYIGKWEWSKVKHGLYFRIIFIFPTSQVGDMKALQNELNFYWCESITEGLGLCHHAPMASQPNTFRKSYCHIKVNNFKERESFKKRVVGYLTKSEKYYCPPDLRQALNLLSPSKTSEREQSLTFRSKLKK